MLQYFLNANDGTDEGALDRRMAVRPFHLEYAKKLKEEGKLINGGAKLSSEGKMIGSAAILQFENEKELNQYIANEPYINNGVWVEYTLTPFKLAVL